MLGQAMAIPHQETVLVHPEGRLCEAQIGAGTLHVTEGIPLSAVHRVRQEEHEGERAGRLLQNAIQMQDERPHAQQHPRLGRARRMHFKRALHRHEGEKVAH